MSDVPKPRLLLGEGVTDLVVVNSLCDQHGIPDDWYDYLELQGVDQLLRKLPSHLKESGRQYVAVVLDADENPAGRWQAIADRIGSKLGYALPTSPIRGGTIIAPPSATLPLLGIWMMPDNSGPGMLEDFLKALVRPGDPLFPRALQTVAGIPDSDRRFIPFHLPKAEMYTWAAWQAEPGTALGNIIKRGELDAHADAAQEFSGWIRRIFPPPSTESVT
jgi:hypothetical protein